MVLYVQTLIEKFKISDTYLGPGGEIDVGWLGSYPRPAFVATLVIRMSDANSAPVSDLSVVATIYEPDPSTKIFGTVTFHESSMTAGIYLGYFKIKKTDPTGSYPVKIVAQSTGHFGTIDRVTLYGHVDVYLGTARGITYR